MERAIKKLEDSQTVAVTLETKFKKLEEFEAIVVGELTLWRSGKMRRPSLKCRGCQRNFRSAAGKSQHEKTCEFVRDDDGLLEPISKEGWCQLALDRQVPTPAIGRKVAGRFQDEGWAASAEAAARARRLELEKEKEKVGTADAKDAADWDAARDAFNVIADVVKDHELAACRDLASTQLEDRLRPRAKARAAHCSAYAEKGGDACAASGACFGNLAKANKALRASRIGKEYKASGYAPHNNTADYQEARFDEDVYEGADHFQQLRGDLKIRDILESVRERMNSLLKE